MTTARIDMRIDPEIKKRVDRAATLLGFPSLTAYLTRLMDEDSRRVLTEHTQITLENDLFDRFAEACFRDDAPEPNEQLKAAVQRTRDMGMLP